MTEEKFNKLTCIALAAILFVSALLVVAPTVSVFLQFGLNGIIYLGFLYGAFRYCEYTIKCIYIDLYQKGKIKIL